jgi:hypothetical protein
MQCGVRILQPLIRSYSTTNRAFYRNTTGFSPRNSVITRGSINSQTYFTMSSAPAPDSHSGNNAHRRSRGGRRGKPRGQSAMSDVALTTADPRRATLAARLAVPASDTPIVSSSAVTPAGATPAASRPQSPSFKANFSSVRFEDFVNNGQISKEQHKNIPFEFATEVQAKTLGHILAGKDV